MGLQRRLLLKMTIGEDCHAALAMTGKMKFLYMAYMI